MSAPVIHTMGIRTHRHRRVGTLVYRLILGQSAEKRSVRLKQCNVLMRTAYNIIHADERCGPLH